MDTVNTSFGEKQNFDSLIFDIGMFLTLFFSFWRRVRTAYVNVRAWTLSSKHIIKLLSSDPLTIFCCFISYLRSYNFVRGAFGERFEKLTDYERLQFHFVGLFFSFSSFSVNTNIWRSRIFMWYERCRRRIFIHIYFNWVGEKVFFTRAIWFLFIQWFDGVHGSNLSMEIVQPCRLLSSFSACSLQVP